MNGDYSHSCQLANAITRRQPKTRHRALETRIQDSASFASRMPISVYCSAYQGSPDQASSLGGEKVGPLAPLNHRIPDHHALDTPARGS